MKPGLPTFPRRRLAQTFLPIAVLAMAALASVVPAAAETPPATSPPAASTPKFDGWSGPKPSVSCLCRNPEGGKLPVGAQICVRRGDRMVTLRCEMGLNNTIWKERATGCAPDPTS